MTHTPTHGRDYCSHLIRARDEDRWLAAQYAQGKAKRALNALYAFHCELRRIPSAVSEPPLGEIRLQWWREALAEIRAGRPARAHPVVEAIAASGVASEKSAPHLDAVIDAAARPLYGEGFADAETLAAWLKTADGAIDAMAARLAGGDEELAAAAADAGAAFALAREGAILAPALTAETKAKAKSLWEKTKPRLKQAPPALAPAIAHLSLTPLYLKRAGTPFPLAKRARLFSAVAFDRF